jgi:hypothetical protein
VNASCAECVRSPVVDEVFAQVTALMGKVCKTVPIRDELDESDGCDNFLYCFFQGCAQRAARLAARDRARGDGGRTRRIHQKAGALAPAGTRRTAQRPLALVRKPTAGRL